MVEPGLLCGSGGTELAGPGDGLVFAHADCTNSIAPATIAVLHIDRMVVSEFSRPSREDQRQGKSRRIALIR
jgi:hypothetical protein